MCNALYASCRELFAGLNTILVPAPIFVNSQLYKEIQNGNISYLQGTKPSEAHMGAIFTNTTDVHIVGMFFFHTTSEEIKQLITLLCHNLTGAQFAHFTGINYHFPMDIE